LVTESDSQPEDWEKTGDPHGAFQELNAIVRGRVELVAIVNEFFDKWPIIAQIEDVPAADRAAGIFVPRLKVSDDFRRLVIALRTWQGEGEALPGGAVGGHVAS
jgi:hypothetical protein